MSLKVWLPLDGDTKNYGTTSVTVTNHGATSNTAGKIGTCYSFDGSDDYISVDGLTIGNIWSYGCWFNEAASTRTWEGLIILNTNGGDADMQLGFYTNPNTSKIQTTANGQYNSGISHTFDGLWHHLFATFDGSTLKTYRDGLLIDTKSITNALLQRSKLTLGARCRGSSYDSYYAGKINDFRLYDHCLSTKEVKELAQGLALHYKLDDVCGYNLLNNTPKTYAPTSYNAYQLNLTENMVAGQTYTLQFWDVNVSHTGKTDSTLGLAVYWGGGSVQVFPYTTWNGVLTNGHIDYLEQTFTITSSQASGSDATNAWLNIYNSVPSASGTMNMSIGAWRLVKGSVAPKNWEPQNSTLTLVDSSGYKRDATLVANGPFYIENGGPRYDKSIRFSGDNTSAASSYAYSGSVSWFTFDKCTISAWVKPTQTLSGWSGSVGLEADAGNTYKGLSIEPYSNTFYTAVVNANYTLINSGKSLPINEWHHCAVTLDGTTLKQYYDGELVNQTTISWSTATVHSSTRFAVAIDLPGSDECFNGNISDVRFYTTALSNSDILELYQTPINIDNTHKIHSLEFIEDDTKDSFYSSGVVTSANKINYLINNFGETNTLTDWTFTSPTISNGVVTTTGTAPAITSATFTVNPTDIIVVDFTLSMPTTSTKTDGSGGLYLGTLGSTATNRYSFYFNTGSWGAAQSNSSSSWNTYFVYNYNLNATIRIKSYIIGSSVNISNVPAPECSMSTITYTNAIQLTSGTTTNIRAGYNSGNSEMVIKLSDFKIYNINEHGFVQTDNVAKMGESIFKFNDFIEK